MNNTETIGRKIGGKLLNNPDSKGTLYDHETMFFRVAAGSAQQGDVEYELSTHAGQGFPIVRNKITGKHWLIDWAQLIELAQQAGIDDPAKRFHAYEAHLLAADAGPENPTLRDTDQD